jgi:hypothetical protein
VAATFIPQRNIRERRWTLSGKGRNMESAKKARDSINVPDPSEASREGLFSMLNKEASSRGHDRIGPVGKQADVVSPEVFEALSKAEEYARLAASAPTSRERAFYERMRGKWLGIADGWKFIDSVGKP